MARMVYRHGAREVYGRSNGHCHSKHQTGEVGSASSVLDWRNAVVEDMDGKYPKIKDSFLNFGNGMV